MTLAALLGQSITILHPGTKTSAAGDTVIDWSNPTSIVSEAFIEATVSEEDEFLRERTTGEFKVFLKPGTAINPLDRIVWGQHTLEVVGPPRLRHRPVALHHIEVSCIEIKG